MWNPETLKHIARDSTLLHVLGLVFDLDSIYQLAAPADQQKDGGSRTLLDPLMKPVD
jgi:hypothetical protein